MAPLGRDNSLTIGHLAERTGVPPATLRSGSRATVPRPIRLTGGHRRYATDEQLA